MLQQDSAAVITAQSFFQAAISNVRILLGMLVLFVILACVYLWLSTPKYDATMIIGPRENLVGNDSTSSLSGGLSFLKDLGAGQSSVQPLDKMEAILFSAQMAEVVRKDDALLKEMFPGRWDEAAQKWRPNSSPVALVGQLLSRIFLGIDTRNDKPNVEEIQSLITSRLTLDSQKNGLIDAAFTSSRPERSRLLLDRLISGADSIYRQNEAEEFEGLISFTLNRLEMAKINEQRQALASILLSLEQQNLFVGAGSTRAFEVLQPAVADSRPTSPRPLATFAGAVLAAIGLFALFVMVRARQE